MFHENIFNGTLFTNSKLTESMEHWYKGGKQSFPIEPLYVIEIPGLHWNESEFYCMLQVLQQHMRTGLVSKQHIRYRLSGLAACIRTRFSDNTSFKSNHLSCHQRSSLNFEQSSPVYFSVSSSFSRTNIFSQIQHICGSEPFTSNFLT